MKEELKTRQMEKSYHLLFSQIADHCIAHGIDTKVVTDKLENYRVDVTSQFVKETWKSILFTLTGKTSTKDQTREDVKLVQAEFGKLWSEITGEVFNWPSINELMFNGLDDTV